MTDIRDNIYATCRRAQIRLDCDYENKSSSFYTTLKDIMETLTNDIVEFKGYLSTFQLDNYKNALAISIEKDLTEQFVKNLKSLKKEFYTERQAAEGRESFLQDSQTQKVCSLISKFFLDFFDTRDNRDRQPPHGNSVSGSYNYLYRR